MEEIKEILKSIPKPMSGHKLKILKEDVTKSAKDSKSGRDTVIIVQGQDLNQDGTAACGGGVENKMMNVTIENI